jgi:hypothetical protein
LNAVAAHCRTAGGFEDVLSLCPHEAPESPIQKVREPKVATGFVYLMKSGRHYKIGRTKSVGRRGSELAIKIPVPPTTVHGIETGDPVGVESYWHSRFADKRGEGEWLELSPEDVKAFSDGSELFSATERPYARLSGSQVRDAIRSNDHGGPLLRARHFQFHLHRPTRLDCHSFSSDRQ